MEDLSNKYFFMIEPDLKNAPSINAIEDSVSQKMDFVFSKAEKSGYAYKGIHFTQCGECSDNHDWILPNKMITNSLCKYYIRYYRDHIPSSEMSKLEDLYSKLNKSMK